MTAKRRDAGETDWDEKAWKKYAPSVTAICRRLLPHADWESATQEVFLKAFANWKTLRAEEKRSAWINRIARCHCLNFLRDKRNAPLPFDELSALLGPDFLPSGGDYSEVENKIIHAQIMEQIRRDAALRKPPWDALDWRIFELDFGEKEWTLKDIAAILHIDYKQVRYRYYYHIMPLLRKIGQD